MIVQTLEEAGVEYVFGIPGGGTGQIFQLLYGKEDRIKTIMVRHEQVAAIMADAVGRATGKPMQGAPCSVAAPRPRPRPRTPPVRRRLRTKSRPSRSA
jgi:glyoxylate carboligase